MQIKPAYSKSDWEYNGAYPLVTKGTIILDSYLGFVKVQMHREIKNHRHTVLRLR